MHGNGLFKVDNHLGQYNLRSWTKNTALKKKSLQYSQDSTVYIVALLWSRQPQNHGSISERGKNFSHYQRLALETTWPSISGQHGLFPRNCQAGSLSFSCALLLNVAGVLCIALLLLCASLLTHVYCFPMCVLL
jgi:hypothetical protein